jgi:hypothetical protein
MATKTRSASQQVAQLRDKLTFWEGNLRTWEQVYTEAGESRATSLARTRAQLDIIESVRDLLS